MPEADLSADLALLEEAAREGGRIALGFFRKDPEVWMKAGDSPVSEADFAVDRFLRETLTRARPDYGWLSEETADGPARLAARRTFVVDPIDGTRAFVAGWNTWCVSVAIVEAGRPIAGVLDCPALDETFSAVLGGGAFLNGKGVAVRDLSGRIEVTGPKIFLDHLASPWRERASRQPHVPSLAYRLAMIAKGALDLTFVKPGAHDWDLAAAALILREAGGELLDGAGCVPPYGLSAIPRHGALVAGSGALLPASVLALADWQRTQGNG